MRWVKSVTNGKDYFSALNHVQPTSCLWEETLQVNKKELFPPKKGTSLHSETTK